MFKINIVKVMAMSCQWWQASQNAESRFSMYDTQIYDLGTHVINASATIAVHPSLRAPRARSAGI